VRLHEVVHLSNVVTQLGPAGEEEVAKSAELMEAGGVAAAAGAGAGCTIAASLLKHYSRRYSTACRSITLTNPILTSATLTNPILTSTTLIIPGGCHRIQ
jgi:hypothetical protein